MRLFLLKALLRLVDVLIVVHDYEEHRKSVQNKVAAAANVPSGMITKRKRVL